MMVEDSCNMFMSFLEFDEKGNEHLEYLDYQSDYFLKDRKLLEETLADYPERVAGGMVKSEKKR
jgi:hypothetical protein